MCYMNYTVLTPRGCIPWTCVFHTDLTALHNSILNPLISVSHWNGFKVKLTFRGIQFFGSSLYTRQIFGILCLQIDLFLIENVSSTF